MCAQESVWLPGRPGQIPPREWGLGSSGIQMRAGAGGGAGREGSRRALTPLVPTLIHRAEARAHKTYYRRKQPGSLRPPGTPTKETSLISWDCDMRKKQTQAVLPGGFTAYF